VVHEEAERKKRKTHPSQDRLTGEMDEIISLLIIIWFCSRISSGSGRFMIPFSRQL
jgi:hypothetical protein